MTEYSVTVQNYIFHCSSCAPPPAPCSTLTPLNANIWPYYWVRWSLAIKHLYSKSVSTLSQLLHVLCWIGVLQSESKHLLVKKLQHKMKTSQNPYFRRNLLASSQPKWDNRHSQNIFEFSSESSQTTVNASHSIMRAFGFIVTISFHWIYFDFSLMNFNTAGMADLWKVPLLNLRDLKLLSGITVCWNFAHGMSSILGDWKNTCLRK